MDIKSTKFVEAKSKALSVIAIFTIALFSLTPTALKANGTDPGDAKKQQTEAKLVTKIGQWLDGKPVAFEQRTNTAMAKGMHAMGEKMKAYEAQLQAEIDAMERLLGFKSDNVVAGKKIELIKPLGLNPHKGNTRLNKNSNPVPGLMDLIHKPE